MMDTGLVKGIDVSNDNGPVDWEKVRVAGFAFAYIRASYGCFNVDERFEENWAGAKAAGMQRGAYHVFHPDQSARIQANLFCALVPDAELRLAGDFEWLNHPPVPERWGTLRDDLTRNEVILTFLMQVFKCSWKTPRFYGGKAFVEEFLPVNHSLGIYQLWLPHPMANIAPGDMPRGWKDWWIWQQAAQTVPGITGPVDVDVTKSP